MCVYSSGRRESCTELSPDRSPPSPPFASPSPLLALSPGPRPEARTKPRLFDSLSSFSSDSSRLLTSSTWRQWGARGTGADWCMPVCQWRFHPPAFFPPAQTKLCIQSTAPTPRFSSNTDSRSVGRDLLYIDGLIRGQEPT